MKTETLLIEIGSEELPPKALKNLGESFASLVSNQLKQENFAFAEAQAYFTPRRLAVMVTELSSTQPEQLVERKGPALKAAYDKDGNASKAALGFAASCGVNIEELSQLETDKGAWLYFKAKVAGKNIDAIIPDVIENALAKLPIPKPMRWGSNEVEFVRPIHWVVLMYGASVIPCKIKNLATSNTSYGHRFHAPGPIKLSHANDYESALQTANVVADFEQRKNIIEGLLCKQADALNATLDYDQALLEEVTNLVEYPSAITGEFSPSFLDIPQEALVVTMQEAQRYFPLYSKSEHKLLPNFITIANIESKNPETIRQGNERVIKPRFEDAAFFWQRDKSRRLDSRVNDLEGILFEKQLGSLLDKVKRVEALSEKLAKEISIDPKLATRAAQLCKCDLLSEMVNEFPKLQGIMGRYYAENDGEPMEVANAVQEHYQPNHAGDAIPASSVSKVVGICDRIDTLVGIFATGKKPTGVKDPYALRRAALGIIRTSIDGAVDFNLPELLTQAANLLPKKLKATSVVAEVEEFIHERLRGYLSDTGYRVDTVESVRSVQPTSLVDFHRRVQAVHEFRQLPEADSLAAANKRIRNILKKIERLPGIKVNSDLLTDGAERNLYEDLIRMEKSVAPIIEHREYNKALASLAKLKSTIDSFFDDVMVMDDADSIRNNRIALVTRVNNQFAAIADISCLQN